MLAIAVTLGQFQTTVDHVQRASEVVAGDACELFEPLVLPLEFGFVFALLCDVLRDVEPADHLALVVTDRGRLEVVHVVLVGEFHRFLVAR